MNPAGPISRPDLTEGVASKPPWVCVPFNFQIGADLAKVVRPAATPVRVRAGGAYRRL
jgi:hypothetical protein